jgi:hypothetical protein
MATPTLARPPQSAGRSRVIGLQGAGEKSSGGDQRERGEGELKISRSFLWRPTPIRVHHSGGGRSNEQQAFSPEYPWPHGTRAEQPRRHADRLGRRDPRAIESGRPASAARRHPRGAHRAARRHLRSLDHERGRGQRLHLQRPADRLLSRSRAGGRRAHQRAHPVHSLLHQWRHAADRQLHRRLERRARHDCGADP